MILLFPFLKRSLQQAVGLCGLLIGLLGFMKARADSTVVFNEIHYHPQDQEPALEWVELHNQMAVNMDFGHRVGRRSPTRHCRQTCGPR
jgi:hypothetical protein